MKKISILRYTLVAFLFIVLANPTWAIDEQLFLYVGEVKVMHFKALERVAVGNGKLLSTSILNNGQLVILAESEGDTTVHIWRKNGRESDLKVRISASDTTRTVSEVTDLLANVKGISVRDVGGRAVLEGELAKSDMEILKAIQKVYPNIINLTKPSQLHQDKMIYMEVQITEFSTNALEKLGIEWSNPINGPAGAFSKDYRANDRYRVTPGIDNPFLATPALDDGQSPPTSALVVGDLATRGYFGIATFITSRINFMVNNGDALILATPRLSARSGGEAEFLAGGEIPLPTVNAQGQSNVEFKEFGIKLKIKPVTDDQGNVTARVETELSTIDPSVSVQGIPGFITRKTHTDVSMRDGETLVISGLINSEISRDVSKLKFLGDIPILGALFRSKNSRNKKTELVIFVTPTVVDAGSDINKKAIARSQELIQKFEESIGKDIID